VRVSVVVPTYGRERALCTTVVALLDQSFRDFEVIVVDQTPKHDLETERFFADRAGRLRWHREARVSLPHARNVGLQLATGEVVVFVDDDAVPAGRDLISHHFDCYVDPTVGGVAGRIVEPLRPNAAPGIAKVNVWGRIVTNFTGDRITEVHTAKGTNMSFRHEAIRAAGGFDTRFGGTSVLEETDACYRLRSAGWRIVYEPRACVHHEMARGGCREQSRFDGAYWLFRNSALFYRKAKAPVGVPLFLAFFAARGVLQVARAGGGLRGYLRLMRALGEGWRVAREEPQP